MSSLRIGPLELNSPVVLAPMAGVTNVAFRTLCRELELERAGSTSGLYVCEMVTARALVERHPVTMHMTTFGPTETPRSLQLYTVDPDTTYAAAKMIVDENLADHIDMNFGCPVPKVTRKGGGSALPTSAGCSADRRGRRPRHRGHRRPGHGQVPHRDRRRTPHTSRRRSHRGRRGRRGRCPPCPDRCAAVLGAADWDEIARLKEHVTDVPVLGNGDIFDASDAEKMMAQTGCDGVVVGRGCLGRPWLFAELSAALGGRPIPTPPNLGEVTQIMRRHAELLADHHGEDRGLRDMRKHIAWYLRGFPAGSEIRNGLARVSTLAELDDLLGKLDHDVPFPADAEGRGDVRAPLAASLCPTAGSTIPRTPACRGRRHDALGRVTRPGT